MVVVRQSGRDKQQHGKDEEEAHRQTLSRPR